MILNLKKLKPWELNYLEIFDTSTKNQLYFYFKFLKSKIFKNIKGDIVEAGVFRGKSLITSALVLNQSNNKNKKLIWGYDTFKGFPKSSKFDFKKNFKNLFKKNKISKEHYKDVLKLEKYHKNIKSLDISPKNISSSADFKNTSYKFIKKKINYFKISSKIKLIQGDFKNTMKNEKNLPKKISAGLIDCDLYEGYEISLNKFWPRMSLGGKLFLDEYYSLKFPGPRLIVNKFISKNKDVMLIKEGKTVGFERWSLKKTK